MAGPVKFKVVDDELRKLATQSKWADMATQIRIGRTVAIDPDDARPAANALTNIMRSQGLRLRRKTAVVDGQKQTIFWCDKQLGN